MWSVTGLETNRLLPKKLTEFINTHSNDPRYDEWTYGKSHLVLKWLNKLARSSSILDHVEAVLGKDILLWNSFIPAKPPHSSGHFGWHQDGTFGPISPLDQTVTVWLALSNVTPTNGGMRMLPGSWQLGQLEHETTYDPESMLRRGQKVLCHVDESRVIESSLRPGEASFHGPFTLHGSGPNNSDQWRLGIGLNFVSATVSPNEGFADTATLVRGKANNSGFILESTPIDDLHEEAIEHYKWCQNLGKKRYQDVQTID